MFSSPIHGFKVFLVSLFWCVPSSAVINLLIFWSICRAFSRYFPLLSEISLRDVLGVLSGSAFIGIFNSLLVSAIAFLVAPFLRWRVIIVSAVVLTLLEVKLWTVTYGVNTILHF